MADSDRLVRFELLGQEFSFYTAASEEEMEAILSLVREQFEGDKDMPRGTVPANKIAMMACLKMASKYLQLQDEYKTYRNETENRSARLSEEIETRLFPE